MTETQRNMIQIELEREREERERNIEKGERNRENILSNGHYS